MIRGGGTTVNLRGVNCSPLVFVDGNPASAGVIDLDMFDLAMVEGIEVYPGMTSIPPEFVTGHGLEQCGVIAIWSRPFRPGPGKSKKSNTGAKMSHQVDSLVASLSVYTVDDVDEPASLIRGTGIPQYPDSLRNAGVEGRVLVRVVINSDGTLDPESATLISSTNPLFTSAVQDALATARFKAAILNSRPVRQVMQLPFVFRLEASASNR
jgi:TonB family protein